jgi:hypothetical protein
MWRAALLFFAVLMGCAERQPLEATLGWESEDHYVGVAIPDSAGLPGLVRMENDYYVQLSACSSLLHRAILDSRLWFLNSGLSLSST